MFTVGATDLYVHKYMGVDNNTPSKDLTQPQLDGLDPTAIQDLLFLENRDRKYDDNIYRIRGHYNVNNLDFDLSQFGLFLNNDILFITIHYNDMIKIVGRKLMVGDVLELPHLTDYHPLNETIPVGLRRYYQVTDGNYASEGFSATWMPHLWRIKCEPLVDSQEYSNILKKPIEQDNYLGDWSSTATYLPGYTVTYGDKTYKLADGVTSVPAGTPCTDTNFWTLDVADSLKDIIGRYNKNIEINDANIAEAARQLPANGYDRSQLYLVPTYGGKAPAPAVNIITNQGRPVPIRATVVQVMSAMYSEPSPAIMVSAMALQELMNLDPSGDQFTTSIQASLEIGEIPPEQLDTGSGQVAAEMVLMVTAVGPITIPFGTADNINSNASQDPSDPSFDQTLITDPQIMDFRADADPRFHFVARYTPEGFGYTNGYMASATTFVPVSTFDGEGTVAKPEIGPNGIAVDFGTSFPSSPTLGQYFLRIDYLPQMLYRWDGTLWIKISTSVRTGSGMNAGNESVRSGYINNTRTTTLTDGTTLPERQALSNILKIQTD